MVTLLDVATWPFREMAHPSVTELAHPNDRQMVFSVFGKAGHLEYRLLPDDALLLPDPPL